MIDHVSGLDWKKNFWSLDWIKNLRSKKRYFQRLPLPIFCVLLLECQPFKKIALFGKHVLPAVFLTPLFYALCKVGLMDCGKNKALKLFNLP